MASNVDYDYKKVPALAAYIDRVGAEQLNFRRFMIKEHRGNYYTERALIRIDSSGIVSSSVKEFEPSKEEAEMIKGALMAIQWPKAIGAKDTKLLKSLLFKNSVTFEMLDRTSGEIVMVQERAQIKGQKAYLPWTFFSDGKWRRMEPDGPLPFWKPRKKRDAARIMIHEGAKAAQFIDGLCNDPARKGELAEHPWGSELIDYEHWGMIGGALAPHRAHYAELTAEKPVEIVYVCDNDHAGKSALQEVSRHYGQKLKGIMFDATFPASWDLADAMPEHLFAGSGKKRHYKGQSLRALMQPATYATEVLPNPSGSGRSITKIRNVFKEEWLHSVQPEVFVHKDWPNRIHTANEFNSVVNPFSDVDDTSRLLKRDAASKSAVLKYMPDKKPGIYGSAESGRFINSHVPTEIKAEKGDASPFLEFIEHLVPDEGDRTELLRWCATLISCPAIRMLYGVLLISEAQGVGKGTLGEKILAPLVGEVNVSYPSESEIVDSSFNYWLAHKRLAVVHEIYAGHSAKGYNRLKSTLTDRYITVSKKYQANYEIENWLHVFACSNSLRALHLSDDDRRWFIPKITEEKKPPAYWTAFNLWLTDEGGLAIIKGWAEIWIAKNGSVQKGDNAPWSSLKQEIIDEGLSTGTALAMNALEGVKQQMNGEAVLIADIDLVNLIKDQLYNGQHNDRLEKPATLRRAAKARGWFINNYRANVKEWGTLHLGPRLLCSDRRDVDRLPTALAQEGRKLFQVLEFYKDKGNF